MSEAISPSAVLTIEAFAVCVALFDWLRTALTGRLHLWRSRELGTGRAGYVDRCHVTVLIGSALRIIKTLDRIIGFLTDSVADRERLGTWCAEAIILRVAALIETTVAVAHAKVDCLA